MEILSIGEKIKRARIYKGYTLKDLCNGKISVSKMSCIENNKVGLESEILDFIAEKLDVDKEYLNEDIETQIIKNMNEARENINFEVEMKYNLEVAESYGYFNSAFKILHNLFLYYLDGKKNDKVQSILAKYYELCFKSENEENFLIYNMDMGDFLFENKEFYQASNYYHEVCGKSSIKDYKNRIVMDSILNEIKCFMMLKDYNKAFDIVEELLRHEDAIQDKSKLAAVYHIVAILSLRNHKENFQKFENKAIELYNEDFYSLAESKFDYATIFFELGDKAKALCFVKESVEAFPQKDKFAFTKFVLKNIELLIDNDENNIADSFCEDALNFAIDLNKDKLIEKAYYYKSMLLYKENNYISAEMYINLSLDILTKFGAKQDIYKRYMEIGNMYNEIGAISDSLKYFSLAISLEKKI